VASMQYVSGSTSTNTGTAFTSSTGPIAVCTARSLAQRKSGRPGFPVRCAEHDRGAAFIKESRMNFGDANKLHRKSGRSPSFFFFLIFR
jgi:hypothetical protein